MEFCCIKLVITSVESPMIQYKAGRKGIGHQIMDLMKYISFMIHAKKHTFPVGLGLIHHSCATVD